MAMSYMPESLDLMREGLKTQTRRLAKPDDLVYPYPNDMHDSRWLEIPSMRELFSAYRVKDIPDELLPRAGLRLSWIRRGKGRRLWLQVGRESAIVPGRGQASIGTHLIRRLRLQRLEDISEEDAFAEGLQEDTTFGAREYAWIVKGQEFRGEDPAAVYRTGFMRLNNLKEPKGRVIAVTFRVTKWL